MGEGGGERFGEERDGGGGGGGDWTVKKMATKGPDYLYNSRSHSFTDQCWDGGKGGNDEKKYKPYDESGRQKDQVFMLTHPSTALRSFVIHRIAHQHYMG